ncbi:hypothetical protein CCUS01_15599 [Colletotrichum cuscutae]|nr:hypothetical protein CCUS01_15599 [Colletotrichum cuscutae]
MRFLSTRLSPASREEHTCQLRNRRRTALGPGRLHGARHRIFSDVIASCLQSTSVAAAAPRANFSTLPCAHYPSASSQQSPNIAGMPSKPNSQRDSESEVRSWGFPHVFTWTDGPNAHYSPHSHRGLTTHLILRGNLTITYPKDKNPDKVTYGVGDRIDVDAGRVHEVWIGDEGCTYVIGE